MHVLEYNIHVLEVYTHNISRVQKCAYFHAALSGVRGGREEDEDEEEDGDEEVIVVPPT